MHAYCYRHVFNAILCEHFAYICLDIVWDRSNYHRVLGRVSHDTNTEILTLLREDRTTSLVKSTPKCYQLEKKEDEPLISAHQDSQCIQSPRAEKRLYKSAFIGSISVSTASDNNSVTATILPPRWLSGLTWGFTVSRSLQQFNMRYYNIRSNDSSIFMCVKSKDLAGMLGLFQNRHASPFDRDEDGLSLLHVSIETP